MPSPKSNPLEMRGHWEVRGALVPGATLTNAVPVSENISCAGASRIRGRWLSSVAGTLSFAFLRPDGITPYAQNNPGNVVVTAATETKFDIDPHFGEGLLRVTFTPGATGVLTYFDVSQV